MASAPLRTGLRPILKRAGAAATSRPPPRRTFSTTLARHQPPNQIYNIVGRPGDLQTYLQLSSSSRTPLITLWTASYCRTCRTVEPLIRSVIEDGVGEAEGGVGYCEIDYDAPDMMHENVGLTYMITSFPTLLSFDAGEAQVQTKVVDGKKLGDRAFIEEWVRNEARRHGGRGGGGGRGGIFSGLFKLLK